MYLELLHFNMRLLSFLKDVAMFTNSLLFVLVPANDRNFILGFYFVLI